WQDAAEGDSAEILSGSDVDARSTTVAGIGIHRTTPNDVNRLILRESRLDNKGFPEIAATIRFEAKPVFAAQADFLPPGNQAKKCQARYRTNSPYKPPTPAKPVTLMLELRK